MTMQDTQTPTPGAESAADGQTVPGQGTDAPEPQNGSEGEKGNREAKYRVERNEAREALTTAQARIDGLLTSEVHRLAGELAQPSDLFEVGQVSLADLLDDAGNIDSEAVAES